jgi:PAS domain S-box-containing protein
MNKNKDKLQNGKSYPGESEKAKFFLASIVESLENSVVSVDFNTIITSWNKGAERLYGYLAEEVIGKSLTMLTLPEDLEQVLANIESIKDGKEVKVYETERIHKDGHRIHLLITLSPVKDEKGKIIGVSTIARDITKHKQSEGELHEKQSRLNAALAIAQLGTFEWNVRTNALVLDDRSREIFGFAPGEGTRAQEIFDRIEPSDFERVYKEVRDSIKAVSRLETEYRINLPGGSARSIVSISNVTPGADGKAEKMFGVFNDVTERKQAEEKLRFLVSLSQTLQTLAEPDEIMSATARMLGEYLRVNRCAYAEVEEDEDSFRINGDYTRDTFSIVGEFKMSAFGEEALRLMRENQPFIVTDVEQDARAKENLDAYRQTEIAAVISVPLRKKGRFAAGMAVHQKVPRQWTKDEIELVQIVVNRCWESIERARTVRNLRRSEQRIRALINQATAGITQADRSGKFTFVNDRFCEIVGYSREELLKKRVQDITAPEFTAAEIVLYNRVWQNGTPFVIEKQYVRKDGTRVWVNKNVAPVVGVGGETESVACVSIDTTERKTAEDKIRLSEERYRTLFKSIDQGFCVVEVLFDDGNEPFDYRFLEVNPPFEEMTGIPNEDAISGKTARQLVPNLEDKWVEIYGKVAATGESVRFEDNSAAMNRWFDVYAFRVGGEESRRVGILFSDISRQKKAEENLHQSREILRLAMSGSRMGAWLRNLATEEVYWSPELEAIFGLPQGTFAGNISGFYDYVYEEDKEPITLEVERAIAERRSYIIEFRYYHADGSVRWMEGRGKAIYSATGEPTRVYGIGIDITERKREELDRQFLLELGEKIRFGEFRAGELLNEVTAMTSRHLNTARCLFIEVNEAENRGTIKHEFCRNGVASVAGEYKISDYSPATLEEIRSGRTIINYDTENDPRTAEIYKTTYEPYDERSYVSIPLFTNGRWTAIFWVSDDNPRRWTQQEIAFLESVGERAWLATEKLRNEENLRKSEARLRLAIDISRTSTFEIDLLTDEVQTDEIGREMYGFEKDEPLTFARVQSHFHPDDREEVMRKVSAALDPHGTEEFEVEQRIIRTDGATRWIRVRGRAFFEGVGESRRAVRCLGTYIDITVGKQIEQEREKLLRREKAARREAEEASRLKDEFLATVSHELRTPLNAILGWSQMLAADKVNEDFVSRAVKTIYRNAKSQAQLIEDILDVSRIITGKLRIDAKPISVSPIIQTVVESLRPSIEAKNLRLQMRFEFEPRMINADSNRLQQVVWNLLSNAIKFTPENGQITVELESDESETRIIVSDTGKGISPEFLPFVFDRFRQADGSTTRKHGGLGLGLAIVRHIVELHGGAVEVKSGGEGNGTIFTVRLPLSEAALFKVEKTNGRASNAIKTGSNDGESEAYLNEIKGLRVLLIDDEKDTLELLTTVLSQNGAEVRPQTNVRDALEALKDWKPDVIVSDIAMPGEDGYSFIKKLRALPPESGGAIPAVALTAYVGIKERTQVLSSGFQMYVPKPVEPSELISTLASLI